MPSGFRILGDIDNFRIVEALIFSTLSEGAFGFFDLRALPSSTIIYHWIWY